MKKCNNKTFNKARLSLHPTFAHVLARRLLAQVLEEQLRHLEKEFFSLDEKLRRALQQRQKLQNSLRQRRATASQPVQSSDKNRVDVCNAEMQCHAESLKDMLQSLYEAMG